MKNDVFKSLPDNPLLRLDDVATFFAVTKRTVYNWYVDGRVEGCSPNGSIRIYRQSVIDLVMNTEGKVGDVESCKKTSRKIISSGIK